LIQALLPSLPKYTRLQVKPFVGLWALDALLQTWLGSQVAHGPDAVRAAAAQWATTRRLSVWAQGHCDAA
jgi:hypothetical protein